MVCLLYLLYFLLIIIGFIKPKSTFIFCSMLIFMWFLLAFRTGDADYGVYFSRFVSVNELSTITEPLFTTYILFFHNLKLNFDYFIAITAALIVLCIAFFTWKNTPNPGAVIAMYMTVSYSVDGIQMRNTLAFCLILFGFNFLINCKRKKISAFLFSLFVLLGCLVHLASIFFIIFVFANKKIKRESLFLIVIAVDVVLYLLIILSSRSNIISSVSGSTIVSYLLSHANSIHTLPKQIFVFSIKSLIYFALFYVLLKISNNKYLSKKQKKFIDIASKVNILSLLVIPFYFYSMDLYRIQRYLFIIYFVAISFMTPTRFSPVRRTQNWLFYRVVQLASLGVLFFLVVVHSGDFFGTIYSLLENNRFL